MQRTYGEQMDKARRLWIDELRHGTYVDVQGPGAPQPQLSIWQIDRGRPVCPCQPDRPCFAEAALATGGEQLRRGTSCAESGEETLGEQVAKARLEAVARRGVVDPGPLAVRQPGRRGPGGGRRLVAPLRAPTGEPPAVRLRASARALLAPHRRRFSADQALRDDVRHQSRWFIGAEFDWQILRIPKLGTLGPGFGWGYTHFSSLAKLKDGSDSGQDTNLAIMPMYGVAVLRIDTLARETVIPLVAYGKAGSATGSIWSSDVLGTHLEGHTWGTQFALGRDAPAR